MKINKIKQITHFLCKFVKNMALEISKMRKRRKGNLTKSHNIKQYCVKSKQTCMHVKQICVTGVKYQNTGCVCVCPQPFVDPPALGKTILFNANDKNILCSYVLINKKHNITISKSGLNTFVSIPVKLNVNYRKIY